MTIWIFSPKKLESVLKESYKNSSTKKCYSWSQEKKIDGVKSKLDMAE